MDKTNELQELIEMTDMQSERLEILSRIDELDRMTEVTTDRDTLTFISKRKKALRECLENSSKR